MAITAGFLGIDEPATIDKRADTNTMTRAATAVHREVVSIGSPDDATPEQVATVSAAGALKVDGSAVTQPVSGTITATQGTAAAASGAWPTKPTDAAGVNQAAITAAGDTKITLDGEAVVLGAGSAVVGALGAGTNAVGRLTGTVSAANSTTTPLGVGGVFTGAFEEVKDYAAISIIVFADVASAADGLSFEWSPDGTNADVTTGSSVLAATGRAFSITPRARFFRVKYTNGGTGQVTFRLATTYHPAGTGLISRPLDQALDDENYAQTVRAVLDGQDPTSSDFQHIAARTAAPTGSDQGLVVRNIPSGTQDVGGNVAHDAVDSGNPVKVGGKAAGALPAAVAALDRVDAYLDREGRQIVRPWGAGAWAVRDRPAVNVQASIVRAAGAAGVRHVATGLTVVLAAGATAPTAVNIAVELLDGVTVVWDATISLPATAGAMNGIALSGLHIPGTAATSMTLRFSAAGGANTFESVALQGIDITEA